jgi:hypothetical protein
MPVVDGNAEGTPIHPCGTCGEIYDVKHMLCPVCQEALQAHDAWMQRLRRRKKMPRDIERERRVALYTIRAALKLDLFGAAEEAMRSAG